MKPEKAQLVVQGLKEAGVDFAAGVLDLRPASNEHRDVARLLRRKGIRFLFYATHPPEDVTTTRGAPVFLKPTPPQEVVRALAVLIEEEKGGAAT
jgi:hypothetical protein